MHGRALRQVGLPLAMLLAALAPVAADAATVPGVPRGVTASALDSAAKVTWRPPLDGGGSPLAGYDVRVVETGRVVAVPGGGAASTTIGSLSNGVSYTFVVRARNAAGPGPWSAPSAAVVPTRPNIVLVVTDDQRFDSMGHLPATNAQPWLRFTRAYVNLPLCCPSRATILTGRYSHHTRVETLRDGAPLDESRTVATMLRAAGYRTGLVGKYLNGYPFGRGHYTPPGWESFVAFEAPLGYFDYALNVNGTLRTFGSSAADYSTDVLTGFARSFISTTPPSRPLFLEVSYFAPHRTVGTNPTPAPRHVGICNDLPFTLPPNFNAYDTVSEPAWMAGETPQSASIMRAQRRATCATLRAVDEGVMSILAQLRAVGRLDNTYVVFTSDNGYAFGEHRLISKGDLYEAAARVPLLVRGPRIAPRASDRLTSNVDIAPSLLEFARVAPPSGFVDGNSFADIARAGTEPSPPTSILLRGCRSARTVPNQPCGGFRTDMGKNWGLRTTRYKYVEYPDGYRQLFDLIADPYELTNRATDPAYAATVARLHQTLVARRGF